jgi:hypothetical protein
MMSGLHYQVSQATSLQYVDFKASTDADAEQRAIYKFLAPTLGDLGAVKMLTACCKYSPRTEVAAI